MSTTSSHLRPSKPLPSQQQSTQQKSLKQKPFLIVGIGNDFRGDDGFGISVARMLTKQFQLPNVHISRGDASELLEYFEQTQYLILIDAIFNPAEPHGQTHHFLVGEQPLETTQLRSSTHLVSISEAIALGRLLDKLPPYVHIFGVIAQNFDYGTDISDKVREKIRPTCVKIANLVKTLTTEAPPTHAMSSAKIKTKKPIASANSKDPV